MALAIRISQRMRRYSSNDVPKDKGHELYEGIASKAFVHLRALCAYSVNRSYTLKDDPQPQVLFTFGFSNLKPAPSSVST
jgi:hypothetical protein